ncbi:hypothetical protein M0R45_036125 [Rubus argutus]|uniref:Uncharacterized protein n=1 Tax=Rubus argutus TaxID=59490 RepID=A0AAW1VXQ0_RUBAR
MPWRSLMRAAEDMEWRRRLMAERRRQRAAQMRWWRSMSGCWLWVAGENSEHSSLVAAVRRCGVDWTRRDRRRGKRRRRKESGWADRRRERFGIDTGGEQGSDGVLGIEGGVNGGC